MAVTSGCPAQLSLTSRDSPVSPATDSFWRTPRQSGTPGLGSLMAAIQQVLPTTPAPPPKPVKQTQPAGSRRPQCTHMHVKRLYGNHKCHGCGLVRDLGWVYVCEQDRELPQDGHALHPAALPTVDDESDYPNDHARLAESLGIRSDVVQGIRNLHYTYGEVIRLVRQKQHVLETIYRIKKPLADSTPQAHQSFRADSVVASVGTSSLPSTKAASSSGMLMTPAGTPTNTPADSTVNTPVKKDSKHRNSTCNFQVCHICRPFFQDRLYMSFESVLSGHMPALTAEDIAQLPLLNPEIVRNLGLRTEAESSPRKARSHDDKLDGTTHEGNEYDDEPSDWIPTSATISDSDSERLDIADRYPCPGAGICPLWSRSAGCAYDVGFDDGQRALNHGFGPELTRMTPDNSYSRLLWLQHHHTEHATPEGTPGGASSYSTASSISLPTPEKVPLTPLLPTDETFDDAFNRRMRGAGKAASVCPILTSGGRRVGGGFGLGIRGSESSSSLGSEVEVEGGVALTEEAVGTGMPDIFTDGA